MAAVPGAAAGGAAAAAAAAAAAPVVAAATTTTTTTPSAVPVAAPAPAAPAAAAPYATASLYVGDLLPDVSEGTLFDIFKNVGTVASIRVCRDLLTRRSLGYAYVNFHNVADAERALDTMNYTLINNKPCRIMWSYRDPARRRSGAGNIFIKNLDKSVNNQQLYDTFSAFGNILSCKVETDDRGTSKGYGYVHFEKEEEAKSAMSKVDGMLIAGKKVFVGPFLSRRDRIQSGIADARELRYTNVFVKNLDPAILDDQLVDAFKKFGEITSAVVMKTAEGTSRCFGFVNFKEHAAAVAAVEEMNGQTLSGKQIVVCRAQKKSERVRELHRKFEQLKAESAQQAGVNVYIRNLDESYSDEDLRQLFAPFGVITSTKVMRDEKGNSKGFGFVCFNAPEEAHKAISEINGALVHNKPLYVALAQKREFRRAQLETQYAARMRGAPTGMTTPFLPPAGPIFYGGPAAAPGVPGAQRFMYPGAPMMRPSGWRPSGPQQAPRGPFPQMQYMMPMGRAQRPGGRRPGGQALGMMPGQMKEGGMQSVWRGGYKLSPAVRNPAYAQEGIPVPVAPQQMVPVVAQGAAAEAVPVPAEEDAGAAQPPVDYSTMTPEELRQAIGERLFGIVYVRFPTQQQRCGKITGMLLESMEMPELIKLLDDREGLDKKIDEANAVYETHRRKLEEAAQPADASPAGQPEAPAESK